MFKNSSLVKDGVENKKGLQIVSKKFKNNLETAL